MAGTSLFRRLYRGEANWDFIGVRKRWYIASGIIMLICILSLIFRPLHGSIEFVGGDEYTLPVNAGTSISSITDAVQSVTDSHGNAVEVSSVQTAGSGNTFRYIVQTNHPDDGGVTEGRVEQALVQAGHLSGTNEVSASQISATWGSQVTDQAITALVVFIVLVSAFISIRFRDWRVAVAAVIALLHDLVLTAGVYSLTGFLVSPSTVVGLLTILGFSLYDTVVVFDKVDENTRNLLKSSQYTYGEQANMAVNQTLMRSINTSLIGLLPVAGLLFVGAGILGASTLKDLALVLFVGMLTGAYSSLFLATPWLVDLKMLDKRYKNHAARVLSRRAAAEAEQAAKAATLPQRSAEDGPDDEESEPVRPAGPEAYSPPVPPRVGAKPTIRSASAGGTATKRTGSTRPATRPGSAGGKRRG